MSVGLAQFYTACPGVVLTGPIDAALHALSAAASDAAIRAAVLPLIGGTLPVLPAGLKRFQDSNPSPRDGWSIDQEDEDGPGGRW